MVKAFSVGHWSTFPWVYPWVTSLSSSWQFHFLFIVLNKLSICNFLTQLSKSPSFCCCLPAIGHCIVHFYLTFKKIWNIRTILDIYHFKLKYKFHFLQCFIKYMYLGGEDLKTIQKGSRLDDLGVNFWSTYFLADTFIGTFFNGYRYTPIDIK